MAILNVEWEAITWFGQSRRQNVFSKPVVSSSEYASMCNETPLPGGPWASSGNTVKDED